MGSHHFIIIYEMHSQSSESKSLFYHVLYTIPYQFHGIHGIVCRIHSQTIILSQFIHHSIQIPWSKSLFCHSLYTIPYEIYRIHPFHLESRWKPLESVNTPPSLFEKEFSIWTVESQVEHKTGSLLSSFALRKSRESRSGVMTEVNTDLLIHQCMRTLRMSWKHAVQDAPGRYDNSGTGGLLVMNWKVVGPVTCYVANCGKQCTLTILPTPHQSSQSRYVT